MKMKREKLIEQVYFVLRDQLKQDHDAEFSYGLYKNFNWAETEYKNMLAVKSTVLKGFEEERIKICEAHAEKGQNGQPKLNNGKYIGLEDNIEFETAMNVLSDKYVTELAEWKKFVDGEFDFTPCVVPHSEWPKKIKGILYVVLDFMHGEDK